MDHKWKYFRKGGLRMWVLSILQDSPCNGAEIMNQIEIASRGWWRPSPGSVYPLLEQLQKEGRIQKRDDDKYELTERGKEEFEWPWGERTRQPRTADEVIAEINGYISYLEDLNRSDKSGITARREQLKSIKDRLADLINSG
jgi:DNA-binding PadR family transcriptional regulator